MAKYIYPAIFSREGSFYNIRFPDIENCYTQGESLQDAYEMASDVLCLTLYNLEEENAPIPQASDIAACKTEKMNFRRLSPATHWSTDNIMTAKQSKRRLQSPLG